MQTQIETLEKKWSQKVKTGTGMRATNMARVVKPAKAPPWTKNMNLETFVRQLNIWQTSNADFPKGTQYQDLMESLKTNKEIKGLESM